MAGIIDMRAAVPGDAGALAAIYGPYVVTNAVSFESAAPSVDNMRARIEAAGDTHPWIVAYEPESAVVLGYAFAKPFRPGAAYRFAVETACYVATEVQGRGIRQLLYSTLIATLTAQNFTQAVSTLTLPQDKAIQLHEAIGFRRAGVYREVSFKNGQWIDVGVWQRDLADAGATPDEPLSIGAVGVRRG